MGSEFTPILLLVALLALFYLVVLRPARRQQQTTATIQRNLEVGDDVVLSSGIFGRIVEIHDARVRLEVAPGVVIDVARQVVVRQADDPADADPPSSRPAGSGTEDPATEDPIDMDKD